MSTVQLKVTLPVQLQDYLHSRAQKYGLTMSSYVKNLIVNDVKDMDMPTYVMSEKTEQVALKALDDHKKGKTHEIKDIDAFFNSL